MPKVTSVNFSIKIDGTYLHRLARLETSLVQARYFRHLAKEARLDHLIDDQLERFLARIFLYNPANLKEAIENHQSYRHPLKWRRNKMNPKSVVRRHIKSVLTRYRIQVPDKLYRAWERRAISIGTLASNYVRTDRTSSAENPLLAIPMALSEDGLKPGSVAMLMSRLEALLRAADAAPDNDLEKLALIRCYFEYGLRWEIMAWCQVPLDEPFTISVHERREVYFGKAGDSTKRSLKLKWWHPTATTSLSFHDADTNHVHVSVPDNGVEFTPQSTKVLSDGDDPVQVPHAEHKTIEHYARSDAHNDRPDFIWLQCRLRQPLLRRWTVRGVVLAILAAIYLLFHFTVIFYDYSDPHPLNGGDVVAILIPVTVTASLLLATETTTLAMHVKRVSQLALMLSLAILWAATVFLYIKGHITVDDMKAASGSQLANLDINHPFSFCRFCLL